MTDRRALHARCDVRATPEDCLAKLTTWSATSNVGGPALTRPLAAASATWLTLSDTKLAYRWVILFCAAMAIIGATKLLYPGYGWELRSLDFRVISGHTALATPPWTITIALLSHNFRERAIPEASAGLSVGLVTGVARVSDHTHSLPEGGCRLVARRLDRTDVRSRTQADSSSSFDAVRSVIRRRASADRGRDMTGWRRGRAITAHA
jgi:hypothetical protein